MRGDTLIEVLIALGVVTVVISAVTVLGISSLSNARFSANQEQASKYTQEGMEIVRGIRNSNYAGFASYINPSEIYCLGENLTSIDPDESVSSCTEPNIGGQYIRSVTIVQDENCGANFAHTTVTVAFADNKCASGEYCHSNSLDSCLSTLAPVQGP